MFLTCWPIYLPTESLSPMLGCPLTYPPTNSFSYWLSRQPTSLPHLWTHSSVALPTHQLTRHSLFLVLSYPPTNPPTNPSIPPVLPCTPTYPPTYSLSHITLSHIHAFSLTLPISPSTAFTFLPPLYTSLTPHYTFSFPISSHPNFFLHQTP